jgi:hypothetical protein
VTACLNREGNTRRCIVDEVMGFLPGHGRVLLMHQRYIMKRTRTGTFYSGYNCYFDLSQYRPRHSPMKSTKKGEEAEKGQGRAKPESNKLILLSKACTCRLSMFGPLIRSNNGTS